MSSITNIISIILIMFVVVWIASMFPGNENNEVLGMVVESNNDLSTSFQSLANPVPYSFMGYELPAFISSIGSFIGVILSFINVLISYTIAMALFPLIFPAILQPFIVLGEFAFILYIAGYIRGT